MPVYRSLAPLAFETYNDGRCALVVGALDRPTTLLCYPSEAEAETYWLGDLQKMAAAAQQTGLPLPPPADNTAFLIGIGTVRACVDCGCLVAGGPSRCTRCVREAESASKSISTTLLVDGKEVSVTHAPCPPGCEMIPVVAEDGSVTMEPIEFKKKPVEVPTEPTPESKRWAKLQCAVTKFPTSEEEWVKILAESFVAGQLFERTKNNR